MLLPGPEAQQLAIYIGWVLNGTRGGIVAGTLFILPGIAAILLLSILYALFGHLAPIEALFFGLKSAVLAIVIEALMRIGRRSLQRTPMRLIAAFAFIAIFFFAVPFPLVVLAAAAIGILVGNGRSVPVSSADIAERRRPLWLPLTLFLLW